jgi:hypothetical protein
MIRETELIDALVVAAPIVAVEVDALPPEVGSVAARVRCAGRFEGQSVVTEEMWSSPR